MLILKNAGRNVNLIKVAKRILIGYIINVFRNIVRIFLIIVKGGISYEMSFLRSR